MLDCAKKRLMWNDFLFQSKKTLIPFESTTENLLMTSFYWNYLGIRRSIDKKYNPIYGLRNNWCGVT